MKKLITASILIMLMFSITVHAQKPKFKGNTDNKGYLFKFGTLTTRAKNKFASDTLFFQIGDYPYTGVTDTILVDISVNSSTTPLMPVHISYVPVLQGYTGSAGGDSIIVSDTLSVSGNTLTDSSIGLYSSAISYQFPSPHAQYKIVIAIAYDDTSEVTAGALNYFARAYTKKK